MLTMYGCIFHMYDQPPFYTFHIPSFPFPVPISSRFRPSNIQIVKVAFSTHQMTSLVSAHPIFIACKSQTTSIFFSPFNSEVLSIYAVSCHKAMDLHMIRATIFVQFSYNRLRCWSISEHVPSSYPNILAAYICRHSCSMVTHCRIFWTIPFCQSTLYNSY